MSKPITQGPTGALMSMFCRPGQSRNNNTSSSNNSLWSSLGLSLSSANLLILLAVESYLLFPNFATVAAVHRCAVFVSPYRQPLQILNRTIVDNS